MEQGIALYENLTVISGIVAAVFLVVSVILYFAFDIKSIISKRLGLTEKKELKRMQADAEAAEKAARKRVQGARAVASGSARSTRHSHGAEKPHNVEDVHSTEVRKKPESILATLAAEQENERMMQEAMAATMSKNAGYSGDLADSETTKLDTDSETTKLDIDSETTQLGFDDETSRLVDSSIGSWQQRQFTDAPDGIELGESGDTVVLHEEAETAVLSQNADAYPHGQFMLVRHIMLIHTDEVIA